MTVEKIEWSPQQEGALKAIAEWHKEKKGEQVFRLMGYAGTGKTTLAKKVAEDIKGGVCFGAFTGKAASVMRRKGCDGAATIHSLIYKVKKGPDGQPANPPEFVVNYNSEIRHRKLVIIDECSMLGEEIGKDLLSFGTKILVLGDPAQLPPIKGHGFFTEGEPDVMLTDIHRQARDNPIIRMSMTIREGKELAPGVYGESIVLPRVDIDHTKVMEADQVIVGLNRTRYSYNARMRELHGRKNWWPEKDDKLVCLKNNCQLGIFNGTLWVAKKCKPPKEFLIAMTVEPDEGEKEMPPIGVHVRQEFFTGHDKGLAWEVKRGTQEFTYGYALTCHKSQGSQWNNVMVFDESAAFREDARRWLYTAVTRAAEKVTVVQ